MPRSRTTLSAFTASRRAADRYVTDSMRQLHTWSEESVTEKVIMTAHPTVRYVDFNRHEEDLFGADWLWWFVDRSGAAFGALVQAKKLKVHAHSCSVDFQHPGGARRGKQMHDLVRTAEWFEVPAVYALYCGTKPYRQAVTECPVHGTRGKPCQRCERASILLLPALAAVDLAVLSPSTAGDNAFRTGIPLEDLVDPEFSTDNFTFPGRLTAELAGLFEEKQGGARDIAKAMLRAVKDAREILKATSVDLGDNAVFDTVPAGPRPFGPDSVPFPHILRGLQRSIPEDVVAAVEFHDPSRLGERGERIGGVVVVGLDGADPFDVETKRHPKWL